MGVLRQFVFYTIVFVSVCVITISMLSLIPDLSYWYYNILDFPRLQYLILALVCLLVFTVLKYKWSLAAILLTSGLLATIVIQSIYILPYFIADKTVPDAEKQAVGQQNTVGIMTANVLITNKQAADFLQIVKNTDPDMLLVMEVDKWWVSQLEPLKNNYPYTMEYPTSNAYGMALYSRLPLENTSIKFLNHEDVPSFHARVVLPSGKAFIFHGVHPVAPVPSSKYPDNVGEEEVALLKIGKIVAKDSLPAIVAGDFNDVSWSHTSRLFGQEGNLNNVRIGRGLYNTFSAKSVIQRWPIDHYFVTKEFALLELERLQKFGSDHFPMYAKFVF